jgi:glutaminyl-peptide cyclotransferase
MRDEGGRVRKFSGQTAFLAGAATISVAAIIAMAVFSYWPARNPAQAGQAALTLDKIPFNGARAYDYLKQVCAIGPRRSGSAGMAAQQKLLTEHFQKLGGKVELQQFTAPHPEDGSEVRMANLIVHWAPESKERLLLCAHYDTRPFPDRDSEDPKGMFIGANDGGSGVAVLMELAHQMAERKSAVGVDFVLFDGEELVFAPPSKDPDDREVGNYFLGSEHFAVTYATGSAGYRYRWAVLLDMVGGTDLKLFQEPYSVSWADTRPLVKQIWDTAARLGVKEFVPRVKQVVVNGQLVEEPIRDDHLALHNAGGIPACDLIDFDYPPWHTRGDTPDKCSALSLAKVGWVLSEWLNGQGINDEGRKSNDERMTMTNDE